MRTYMVPINDADEGESQTVDVVELTGTKKKRLKQWREYLRIRLKTQDVHTMDKITKELGFEELLP